MKIWQFDVRVIFFLNFYLKLLNLKKKSLNKSSAFNGVKILFPLLHIISTFGNIFFSEIYYNTNLTWIKCWLLEVTRATRNLIIRAKIWFSFNRDNLLGVCSILHTKFVYFYFIMYSIHFKDKDQMIQGYIIQNLVQIYHP